MAGSRTHDLSTLRRGLDILNLLRRAAWRDDINGWGNNRIAEALGADKSQVSRALKVLAESGLVVRDEETRTYRLGWAIYSLGMRAADQHLMRLGSVVVRKAVSMTGARVFLVVREGVQTVTIWSDAPSHVRPIVDSIGMTYPVVATDTGRALLYGSDAYAIQEIIKESGLDEARGAAFAQQVARDKQAGFSQGVLSDQRGAVAAVPVWSTGHRVVASLGATSPTMADQQELTATVRVLLSAAAELTRHLTAEMRAEVAVSAVPYQGWPALPEESKAR
ncbi:IclR family transcriptional regulator [Amycolatopsis jejuensis]|uniref:IclR family transcriptional regulator n=1 Tax=Amycolatopsis jejuensis TaxID=330084 RepID=UPI00068AF9DD|nr:helix-turn-helix domain-containing protein [Amycolatopsis jejuensis]